MLSAGIGWGFLSKNPHSFSTDVKTLWKLRDTVSIDRWNSLCITLSFWSCPRMFKKIVTISSTFIFLVSRNPPNSCTIEHRTLKQPLSIHSWSMHSLSLVKILLKFWDRRTGSYQEGCLTCTILYRRLVINSIHICRSTYNIINIFTLRCLIVSHRIMICWLFGRRAIAVNKIRVQFDLD